MKKTIPPTESLRRASWVLFGTFLFAFVFLYHPQSGWNVNTRLNLMFALVDQGRLEIDAFHDTPPYETGDKAVFNGHYYSDKTFGSSLLAIGPYWLATKLTGGPIDFHPAHFLMKAFGSALPGAVAVALFFLLLSRLGTPPKRAILLTVFAVCGTMWFGYGTVFYPYVAGMAASLGALYLILHPPADRITPANSFGAGLLLGYTMLCDLIFGLIVVALALIWLLRMLDQVGVLGARAFAEMKGDRSQAKHLVAFSILATVGGILPLSLFAAYCYAIFGSLTIPYAYEADPIFREGMQQGLMGITRPNWSVLYFLTVHPYRGIFLWSPVLIAAVVGLVLGTRQYGKRRIVGWLGLWSLFSYLLFNTSYYMWWGGWSMGPRLLLPMFPFVLLGLGELARRGKLSAFENMPRAEPFAWWGTCVLGAVSMALMLPLSLTEPQIPQGNQPQALLNPTLESRFAVPQKTYLSAFYSGNVTISPSARLDGWIGSENRGANVALILIYLGLIGGFTWLAIRVAPEKLPDTARRDYPSRTVDGTAAPPPPKG